MKKLSKIMTLFIILMLFWGCGSPPNDQQPPNGNGDPSKKPIELVEVTPDVPLPSGFPQYPNAVLTHFWDFEGLAYVYTYTVKAEPFDIINYLVKEYRKYGLYSIGVNYSMYVGDYDIILSNGTWRHGEVIVTLEKHWEYEGYYTYGIEKPVNYDLTIKVEPLESFKIEKDAFEGFPILENAFLGRYEGPYQETYFYYLPQDWFLLQYEHLDEPYEQLLAKMSEYGWEITSHGEGDHGLNYQIEATKDGQDIKVWVETWLHLELVIQGTQIRVQIQS